MWTRSFSHSTTWFLLLGLCGGSARVFVGHTVWIATRRRPVRNGFCHSLQSLEPNVWVLPWDRSRLPLALDDRSNSFHVIISTVDTPSLTIWMPQDYWVFGRCPSSGILTHKNTTFRKLDLFPSSGDEGTTSALLGPSEKTNVNHWTPPPNLRTETDVVSETFSSIVFRIPDVGQSTKTQ
jgi:hypothetical protein